MTDYPGLRYLRTGLKLEIRYRMNVVFCKTAFMLEPEMIGNYSDPATRYQLKLAQVEAKEKSSRRMATEFATRIQHLDQEAQDQKSSMRAVEASLLETQKELIREKERSSRLDKIAQTNLTRTQAAGIKAQNENMRIENTQLRAALDTFRHLHEAAVREAKTLRVAVGRNDDENIHLRREVRELQSETDENALIGKLFNQVLTEKWTEATMNKKYDQILDDLRRAQMNASSLEEKLRKSEEEMFSFSTGAAEKVNLLERQLQEARMNALPMVSLAKLEELNLSLKRIANQKLELEIANKKLRVDALDNQVRLDNYVLREKGIQETEEILRERHPDELSRKILELSERLSGYKLAELKAQREASLIKEREEYYMRVNKTQTEQISTLEEQVAKNDAVLNEREVFWRARYNDQLKLMSKNAQGIENQFGSTSSNAGLPLTSNQVNKIVRDGIQSSNNDLIHTPSNRADVGGLSRSVLESDTQILRDKIRFLEDDNRYKDLKIEKLDRDIQTRQIGVNYRTDNVETLVIGDLEAKTRDIATAAQQTVMTLQQMLDEKSGLVADREKKIDQLREDLASKSKQLSRIELENENLKRQVSVSENNRMNVEQYTTLRTMQKIGQMDQRDIEKMAADYENKLSILANELIEAEKVNREMLQNLRQTRGEAANFANTKTFEANMSELETLKRQLNNMTDLYKKKCQEMKKLNNVLTSYTLDLEKKQEEITKLKQEEGHKLIISRNESAPHEAKIAVPTNKFNQMNDQVKEDQKLMQELKLGEVRNRGRIKELSETIDRLNAQNAQLRDEGSRMQGKKLASVPVVNLPLVIGGQSNTPARRPSSAAKKPAGSTPQNNIQPAMISPKSS